MAFNIYSFQLKTSNKVIACQLFGGVFFAVSFFMLGKVTGGLLNVVAVMRAIVYRFKDKLHSDHILWFLFFEVLFVASYVLTFTVFKKEFTPLNAIIELLPVIGMTATTISFRLTDAKAIRRYGLISSPCWLVYNIANFSIGAILCEILSLGSIVLGILRLDKQK